MNIIKLPEVLKKVNLGQENMMRIICVFGLTSVLDTAEVHFVVFIRKFYEVGI